MYRARARPLPRPLLRAPRASSCFLAPLHPSPRTPSLSALDFPDIQPRSRLPCPSPHCAHQRSTFDIAQRTDRRTAERCGPVRHQNVCMGRGHNGRATDEPERGAWRREGWREKGASWRATQIRAVGWGGRFGRLEWVVHGSVWHARGQGALPCV